MLALLYIPFKYYGYTTMILDDTETNMEKISSNHTKIRNPDLLD